MISDTSWGESTPRRKALVTLWRILQYRFGYWGESTPRRKALVTHNGLLVLAFIAGGVRAPHAERHW